MFKVELPTHLLMGIRKPKAVPLNLNHYRNADFNQLNNMKILFDKIVAPRLSAIPLMDRISLTYRLYMPSKRAVDVSNVCCIVDKFFSDTLKNANKIPDDNMEVISSVQYLWGGVDKENPRVEVTLNKKENPVQITSLVNLTNEDIITAVEKHVREELSIREETHLDIDITFTVGGELTGQVTIGGAAIVAPQQPKADAPRRGRPPKNRDAVPDTKPEPAPQVEEPLTVDETPEAETDESEGTIYPPLEPLGDLSAAEMQEAPPEVEQVTQEATVAPVVPSKGLFPSKETSSPTPPAEATEKKPEPKPVAPTTNTKSLFNLAKLTSPKNEEAA